MNCKLSTFRKWLMCTASVFILGNIIAISFIHMGCREFETCAGSEINYYVLGGVLFLLILIIVFILGIITFSRGLEIHSQLSLRYQVSYWAALIVAMWPIILLCISFFMSQIERTNQLEKNRKERTIPPAEILIVPPIRLDN